MTTVVTVDATEFRIFLWPSFAFQGYRASEADTVVDLARKLKAVSEALPMPRENQVAGGLPARRLRDREEVDLDLTSDERELLGRRLVQHEAQGKVPGALAEEFSDLKARFSATPAEQRHRAVRELEEES